MQVQRHRLLGQRRPQPVHLPDSSTIRAASADCPGRPGTAAANASRAPCLATRQVCSTVERSTPHRSAASRWVHSLVSTATNISYF